MADTIRAFVAIPLSEAVRSAIEETQRQMRRLTSNIRWVPPGNIHLTLKFLGDVHPQRVDAIAAQMDLVAAASGAPFPLKLGAAGAFPSVHRARVLWLGVDGETDRLLAVQTALESALEHLGINREKRRFRAHLTIGRARRPVDGQRLARSLEALTPPSAVPFAAAQLNLYESSLKPGGAVYTCLHTAHLVD